LAAQLSRTPLGSAVNPTKAQQIEWRFGDREDSIRAWLQDPDELDMVVHFRSPEGGQWNSIMTVTRGWLRKHAEEPALGGIWPALLIVPDGSRPVIEKSIAEQLTLGWRLVIHNAEPLPGEPTLPDPGDL
jgi:hypothetical protein